MNSGPNKQTQEIWKLYNAGATPTEIAEKLDLSYGTITSAISRGRDAGAIYQEQVDRTPSYMPKGTVGYVLQELADEQKDWLQAQTIDCECATIAEYLLELVRDAHAEMKDRTERAAA